MARKGFWQSGKELGRDLDRVAASLTLVGPTLAAQRIVTELQQAGPSWSGKFSNSWQIEGPQGQTVKGDGQPGEPRPVVFSAAPFTGQQAAATLLRTTLLKDKVIFKISNFSVYADIATDLSEGIFTRPTPLPQTALGRRKFYEVQEGRKGASLRWDIGGGNPKSESSRTADKDWLPTYAGGGSLPKAIQIEMDAVMRGLR